MGDREVLVSGIKPTGRLHIGNFFGAMQQFVKFQDQYEAYIFVANYHALTSTHDKKALSRDSFDIVADYLAVGLDPKRTTLYLQSDVPQVTELAWVFNTLTTMSQLQLAHAYKDAEAKGKGVNVGTFTYPMLMAADIIAPGGHVVPVGKDQEQHVEMAREVARKFNNAVDSDVLVEPKALIQEEVATIPGIDGRKMSKGYKNTVPLFGTDEEWEDAVMSIVTDSKGPEEPKNPEECTIFNLHELFSVEDLPMIERRYREGGLGYKESKEWLLKNLKEDLTPLREKREEISADRSTVLNILKEGGTAAQERAEKTLAAVREHLGLTLS